MERFCINNAVILTGAADNPVLTDRAVIVENGLIADIVPAKQIKVAECPEISGSGKVLMPGLINVHHHFYSTLARGLGKAAPSRNFNEVLKNLWWRLDKRLLLGDVYYSALISCLDAVRHGTTTIIDHHASPGAITGSLREIANAVKLCGLRANLCYEVSDRDGESAALEGIRENTEWLRESAAAKDEYLKALFGLHAAFTLGDKTLELVAGQVKSLNCGIHIHTAEAASDEDYNLQKFGKRVVNRLEDFGLWNDRSIAAHCVHIDEEEMDILAQRKVAVAHNPQSNLNNAVGIADVVKLAQKGITVGLGTDAMTALGAALPARSFAGIQGNFRYATAEQRRYRQPLLERRFGND